MWRTRKVGLAKIVDSLASLAGEPRKSISSTALALTRCHSGASSLKPMRELRTLKVIRRCVPA